ncbi:nitrogenase component 1 [Methanoplanus endosymbiosus]|uniref:Oxalate:formate antiporter n=1 Tax=Methanoplanus endosymbiosus TaxID=33865 RepID=A0A9E7TJE6_9EURY|nr:nitrogenase component 1 [Methanoplanus endosymbiosus]UUX91650.1 oxalate:formate antiporter [Methanoplanus endosymbiosus]
MNLKTSHSDISRHEGCTIQGALSITAFVDDAITIIHGPSGCTHQSSAFFYSALMYNGYFDIPFILSSEINENDIIFGGEKKLAEAIEKALTYNPKAVFVLGTCVSATIGDSIEEVCREYTDIPVIPVNTAGFLGGSFTSGFEEALLAVSALIAEDENAILKKTKKQSKTKIPSVNIIGEKNLESDIDENYAEVKRLLKLLNVGINMRLARHTSVSDIQNMKSADLNIFREKFPDTITDHFTQKTGLKYIEEFPAGFTGSIEFIKKVAEKLDLNPGYALAEERKYQQSIIEEFSDIKGRTINFDSFGFQNADYDILNEMSEYFGIKVDDDGTEIPIPFSAPVGSTGIKRMLHQWRRFLRHAE